MYAFDYSKASNETELSESLNGFFNKSKKPKLLEIFTPRTANDKVLLEYFNYIK
jgi:2-succinyl-5-enolpyruvyl-6-hydroxy-3-cyclohexene-1-carboxylate synthase